MEKKKLDRTQLTIIVLGLITFILLFTFFYFLWSDVQKKSGRGGNGQSERYVAEQNGESASNISSEYESKIKETLSSMTLEEKVYQMFLVTPEVLCDGDYVTAAGETTQQMLSERPVGGIYYKRQNIATPDQIKEMISNSQSYSKIPLFIGTVEEGGAANSGIAGNSRFNVTQFEDMSAIGSAMDTSKAYEVGSTIGSYMKDLGFNLNIAPVTDVLTNPSNTAIGNRAFSDTADTVSKMVTQVVMGLEKEKISATLKHFPGEGSLDVDPLTSGTVVNNRTLEEIETYDLPPFQAGISAGADFVMVSHAQIPALTGDATPGSLSEEVVKKLLRDKMKFNGVIVTDSMKAYALTSHCTEANGAVQAIAAGCDMIYDPDNVVTSATAIINAVSDGTLTEERINQSVERILRIKYKNVDFSLAGTNLYQQTSTN